MNSAQSDAFVFFEAREKDATVRARLADSAGRG
jgi:hypothetical protein